MAIDMVLVTWTFYEGQSKRCVDKVDIQGQRGKLAAWPRYRFSYLVRLVNKVNGQD